MWNFKLIEINENIRLQKLLRTISEKTFWKKNIEFTIFSNVNLSIWLCFKISVYRRKKSQTGISCFIFFRKDTSMSASPEVIHIVQVEKSTWRHPKKLKTTPVSEHLLLFQRKKEVFHDILYQHHHQE